MKYFYIIAILLICSMCTHKKKTISSANVNNSEIDSVLITYFCGIIETNVAMSCEKLAKIQRLHQKNDYSSPNMEVVDTFLVDTSIFCKVKKILEQKVAVNDFNIDARMFVTIKNKNGLKDHVCIGQYASSVKYNGKAYSVDSELIFLLRYYSGYYSWINKSELLQFLEFQDTLRYQKFLKQKR